ncbi:fluoride efflux transporter FluC [Cellulomonas aerilata]|uniref:Fluoride-specific ion channel FluC n=1 Tax=Cellulomonas aerilata TaxID=515326 RepID=A0A512DAT6_9CELL|nr:CrcB family protein [Cellulomonas aerilata]GEO33350.1 hypothetical protein CAE01nite_10750 [Cellulomonas aerilata]
MTDASGDRPDRPDRSHRGEAAAARSPAHRSPRLVAVVAAGGALGTAARYAVSSLAPDDTWPWGTWSVNVVGALGLGVLLGWLALRGPDEGRRREVRLLVGTGFLGGFTTYSALAVETQGLLAAGRDGTALAYALSTAVLGLAASLGGLRIGATGARRLERARSAPEAAGPAAVAPGEQP